MALLIDGYNLIHAAGIIGRGVGPGGLERARQALLNFLVETVNPSELSRTTVVFDAALAPKGLPRRVKYREIHVRFASDHEDADALLEELIAEDSAPRKLTVVSSDHRVQRAARRRRAIAVDSDIWFSGAIRARRTRQDPSAEKEDVKPPTPLGETEVRLWVEQFLEMTISDPQTEKQIDEMEDPFPPGYAEDLP